MPTLTVQGEVAAARRYRLGAIVAAASVLLIAYATLRPMPVGAEPLAGPWCLVCGDQGTVDILQNVVLFMPLGLGLGLMNLRERRAVFACLAFTALIETSQYFWIPGRDGALGDVAANTLGAWLGYQLPWLVPLAVAPSAGRARLLWGLSLAGWLALILISSASLQPSLPDMPVVAAEWKPEHPGALQWPGSVLAVRVNGLDVPNGVLSPSSDIRGKLLDSGSTFEADVIPASPPDRFSVIARLDQLSGPAAILAEDRGDFLCIRPLRAATFRLREPSFVLGEALPTNPARTASAGVVYHLSCNRDKGSVVLRLKTPFVDRSARIPVTIGMGAVLYLPVRNAQRARSPTIVRLLWLALLLVPTGYWGARWATERETARARSIAWAWLAVLSAAVVAAILFLVPSIFSLGRTQWSEVVASWSGMLAGFCTAFVLRGLAWAFRWAMARDVMTDATLRRP